jgi:hypothetical protein
MFGTQVQKLSVTFWPADVADEVDAGVLLDDEEHPAATPRFFASPQARGRQGGPAGDLKASLPLRERVRVASA